MQMLTPTFQDFKSLPLVPRYDVHPGTGVERDKRKEMVKRSLYKPVPTKGYEKGLNLLLAQANSALYHLVGDLGFIDLESGAIRKGISALHGAVVSGFTMSKKWAIAHFAKCCNLIFSDKTVRKYRDILAGLGVWDVVPKQWGGSRWETSEYDNIDVTYLLWTVEAIEELLVEQFGWDAIVPEHKFNMTRLIFNAVFQDCPGYRRVDPTLDEERRRGGYMTHEEVAAHRQQTESTTEAEAEVEVDNLAQQVAELEAIGLDESEPRFMDVLRRGLKVARRKLFNRQQKKNFSAGESVDNGENGREEGGITSKRSNP
jgi:hypothetical protein